MIQRTGMLREHRERTTAAAGDRTAPPASRSWYVLAVVFPRGARWFRPLTPAPAHARRTRLLAAAVSFARALAHPPPPDVPRTLAITQRPGGGARRSGAGRWVSTCRLLIPSARPLPASLSPSRGSRPIPHPQGSL